MDERMAAAIRECVGGLPRQDNDRPETRNETWFSVGGRVEPGNGGGYTFMVWRDMHNWYAAFPDYHVVVQVGRLQERDLEYFLHKAHPVRVSNPDAEVMIAIIRAAQSIESEIRRYR